LAKRSLYGRHDISLGYPPVIPFDKAKLMDIFYIFLNLLIGLGMGLIYSLMGVGLSLIYGVMKFFNLAHGEFYMVGGYILFIIAVWFDVPMMLALPITLVAAFGFGFFAERILLHDIYFRKIGDVPTYTMIVTIGFSMVMIHSALLAFSPLPKVVPEFVGGIYRLGDLAMSGDRLFAFGVTIILIASLFVFLKKTWTGRALQAVAQSNIGASIVGINIPRFNSIAFAVSCMLASAAGALLAPLFFVYPTSGALPVSKGWIIIVLGGIGSIPGSLIGGLLLGVIEVLGSVFINPSYRDVYGFIALMIILVIRPSGLLGEKVRKA
jgi:branched-chain amino acid transport system permease protein